MTTPCSEAVVTRVIKHRSGRVDDVAHGAETVGQVPVGDARGVGPGQQGVHGRAVEIAFCQRAGPVEVGVGIFPVEDGPGGHGRAGPRAVGIDLFGDAAVQGVVNISRAVIDRATRSLPRDADEPEHHVSYCLAAKIIEIPDSVIE